ncbi:MAG: phosphoribosylglycinamide formyltransferase [Chitinophagaceae bacterium]|nr:phosphoribosylglycinamide formyltransferase [Chitinophagaceae bacterium]
MQLAVFVSGNGSNLQCIIDAIETERLTDTEIKLVVADRDCFAKERALKHKIPFFQFDRKTNWQQLVIDQLQQHQITHIVLAGFLSILPKQFCEIWSNKIINLHPALLPKHGGKGMYGLKVHQAVIDNKEAESGATVHFVTEGIDEGNILLQEKCAVEATDTAETLQQKIHHLEHQILIKAIQLFHEKK